MGIMTAFAVIFFAAGWAGADEPGPSVPLGVIPFLLGGNPTCEGQGYDFGYRIDPVEAGDDKTYAVDAFGNEVSIATSDDKYVDWESNFGIDAIIVKGGNAAHLYVYDPPTEVMADGHLHSPINPSEGPAAISHIDFCFDYEVDVSKTANTTFTRTWDWSIDKTVTPATWDLFTGDSGTSEYTVAVTKTGYTDSAWAVSGTITIENNTPIAATINSVTDVVSTNLAAPVTCGVSFPHVLAPGADLECSYTRSLPDGADRTNTATVTTSGDVGGGADTVDVEFGAPTTEVNATINVEDSFEGDLGEFSDTGSATYARTFTCDADEGKHDNTATIVETGQSDDASVTVDCHALAVTKDATTSLTRTWDWTIDKSADQTSLLLSEGQSFTVNYEVEVSALSQDSAHNVSGNIEVANPAPIDALLNSVTDVVSPAIAGVVDCEVTFPYTLAAGETLECSYSAALPNASDRTNTATATLQNHSYDKDSVGTPSGATISPIQSM
jgi:hypothetical protein